MSVSRANSVVASARSQAGAARLDLLDNVVCWLAHDPSMMKVLQGKQGQLRTLKGDLAELQLYKERAEEDHRWVT